MSKKTFSKKKFWRLFSDYAVIIFGAAVYALSVTVFTAPNNIAPGGFTGIATILNHLFDLPIGTAVLVLNIPVIIWGTLENGKSFLAKTICGTVAASVLIDVFTLFIPAYHGEKILAAIFGGVLSGFGLALVFHRGGTTGGTDIIARNIHKRLPFVSVGKIIFIVDLIVLTAAALVYKNLESGLFAAIAIFVSIKTLDSVVYGVAHDNGKLMFIISDEYDKISKEIMSSLGRGVTILDAEGAYQHSDKKVLLCALRSRQVHLVNSIVKDVDESAFVIVTTATAISGYGFSLEMTKKSEKIDK